MVSEDKYNLLYTGAFRLGGYLGDNEIKLYKILWNKHIGM